ncbi:iron dicitrate transport regulator FecR [Luteolibacter algae]|uniref:Iron dicitrate transport regulator FecR n=1 Tax=Luteolibacter algae TaxID=454151 RepID=A0ABW5D361_9BACT
MNHDRFHKLVALFQTDGISDAEFAELEEMLRNTPEARQIFHQISRIDTRLRREASNPVSVEEEDSNENVISFFQRYSFVATAAILMLTTALLWMHFSKPKVIAELVSTEEASWESTLPTEAGSKLSKGSLKLTTGIATIRFQSGAELMLEAPAKLTLETPMLASLAYGSAVMNVPHSAIGFTLKTPDGYAVDHGTSFAVRAGEGVDGSTFEVIEGEISVHLSSTGEQVRLRRAQSASISGDKLSVHDDALTEPVRKSPGKRMLRIGTNGKCTSVIRNNGRAKWLDPELLMVRYRHKAGSHDRRATFAFDLSGVNLQRMKGVRLRLNQVPSGIGFAARLPEINQFEIYGITNPEKTGWQSEPRWEDSPSPEDGVLLGSFEIPRSKQRGVCTINTPELLDFIKERQQSQVKFLLVRTTGQIAGDVTGLVHSFASDLHPETSGPTLEFELGK